MHVLNEKQYEEICHSIKSLHNIANYLIEYDSNLEDEYSSIRYYARRIGNLLDEGSPATLQFKEEYPQYLATVA